MKKISLSLLEEIVKNACDLFLSRSIESVSIKEIAEKSGVGVATIFRYFSTKKNIVEKCAIHLQTEVFEGFFRLKGNSGYEKLAGFYRGYLTVFQNRPELYKFIKEFDAYMIEEGVSDMEEYSSGLDLFLGEYFSAYEEGLKDGSVKKIGNITAFYYSTTHATLELCKKLSSNNNIVRQDELVSKDTEISTLIGLILSSLKNE